MDRIPARLLDVLLALLGLGILAMGITGGTFYGKIEFSALDPWVAAFVVLASLRYAVGRKASPVWAWLEKGVSKLTHLSQAQSRRWVLIVLALVGALTWLAHSARHVSMGTHAYDVTFLHQPLFHSSAKPILHCDLCIGGSYLGEHLAFTLVPLAAVTSWFHQSLVRDEVIFALQALLLFAPIAWLLLFGPLARQPRWMVYALIVILCSRTLRQAGVWDFREDVIAYAGLAALALGLTRKSVVLLVLGSLTALLSKENAFPMVAAMAVPAIFEIHLPWSLKQRVIIASALVAGAMAYAAWAFGWAIPHWNPGSSQAQNNITLRLGELGTTPREILLSPFTKPGAWLKLIQEKALSREGIKYLVFLLGPWIFVLPRAWPWLLAAAPGVVMNLLPNAPTQRSLQFHYDLMILPALMMGLVMALARVDSPALKRATWVLLIALGLSGRWPGHHLQENWPSAHEWRDHQFLAAWQTESITAANGRTLAQLSQLPELREIASAELAAAISPDARSKLPEWWKTPLPTDRTGIAGHDMKQAAVWILDRDVAGEKAWADAFPGQIAAVSPSGRFVLFRTGR